MKLLAITGQLPIILCALYAINLGLKPGAMWWLVPAGVCGMAFYAILIPAILKSK